MAAPTIVTIRPGVQFTPEAAASFRRAEADLGRQIDVNSTYRDYNAQLRMYNAWLAYIQGRGPYPGHSRALHPDLSMHCKGLALDSDDWVKPGFNTFMAERGWIRTAAGDPTEQHHFEYQLWRDQHRNRPAGGDSRPLPTPIPETTGDIVMRTIFITDMKSPDDTKVDKRQRVLVGEFTYQPMVAAAAKVEYELWGLPENVTLTTALGIRARVDARRVGAGLKPL